MPAGEYYYGEGGKNGWYNGPSSFDSPRYTMNDHVVLSPHEYFEFLRQRDTPNTHYIEGSCDRIHWVVVYQVAKDTPEPDPYTLTTVSAPISTVEFSEPPIAPQKPTPTDTEEYFLDNKRHYNFDE